MVILKLQNAYVLSNNAQTKGNKDVGKGIDSNIEKALCHSEA